MYSSLESLIKNILSLALVRRAKTHFQFPDFASHIFLRSPLEALACELLFRIAPFCAARNGVAKIIYDFQVSTRIQSFPIAFIILPLSAGAAPRRSLLVALSARKSRGRRAAFVPCSPCAREKRHGIELNRPILFFNEPVLRFMITSRVSFSLSVSANGSVEVCRFHFPLSAAYLVRLQVSRAVSQSSLHFDIKSNRRLLTSLMGSRLCGKVWRLAF